MLITEEGLFHNGFIEHDTILQNTASEISINYDVRKIRTDDATLTGKSLCALFAPCEIRQFYFNVALMRYGLFLSCLVIILLLYIV